jgi:hypothetical protein
MLGGTRFRRTEVAILKAFLTLCAGWFPCEGQFLSISEGKSGMGFKRAKRRAPPALSAPWEYRLGPIARFPPAITESFWFARMYWNDIVATAIGDGIDARRKRSSTRRCHLYGTWNMECPQTKNALKPSICQKLVDAGRIMSSPMSVPPVRSTATKSTRPTPELSATRRARRPMTLSPHHGWC